jgi:hypothetical protein
MNESRIQTSDFHVYAEDDSVKVSMGGIDYVLYVDCKYDGYYKIRLDVLGLVQDGLPPNPPESVRTLWDYFQSVRDKFNLGAITNLDQVLPGLQDLISRIRLSRDENGNIAGFHEVVQRKDVKRVMDEAQSSTKANWVIRWPSPTFGCADYWNVSAENPETVRFTEWANEDAPYPEDGPKPYSFTWSVHDLDIDSILEKMWLRDNFGVDLSSLSKVERLTVSALHDQLKQIPQSAKQEGLRVIQSVLPKRATTLRVMDEAIQRLNNLLNHD